MQGAGGKGRACLAKLPLGVEPDPEARAPGDRRQRSHPSRRSPAGAHRIDAADAAQADLCQAAKP